MTVLEQALEGTKSVAILGHVRPDGDCTALLWVCIIIFLLLIRIYRQLYIWRKLPQNLPI